MAFQNTAGTRAVHLLSLLLFIRSFGGGAEEARAQRVPRPDTGAGPGIGVLQAASSAPSTTEGALTLLLPFGAQGMALGRAMTAMVGPETVFWNPAGLAPLEKGRFSVLRGENLAGEATAFSLVLARQPLGVIGFTYHHLDAGTAASTDAQGNPTGTLTHRKHLAILSFGTRILPGFDLGANFKVYRDRESCRGPCTGGSGQTGTAYMVDAGFQVTPLPTLPLRLGALVAHLGTDLQIVNVEQADPLPTRIRLGASYEVLWHFVRLQGLELWLTGEMEDRWRDLGNPVWYLGSEFLAGKEDVFYLRMGYGREAAGGTSGTSVGIGIRYDRFDLSIAKSLSRLSLDGSPEPAHVSLAVAF